MSNYKKKYFKYKNKYLKLKITQEGGSDNDSIINKNDLIKKYNNLCNNPSLEKLIDFLKNFKIFLKKYFKIKFSINISEEEINKSKLINNNELIIIETDFNKLISDVNSDKIVEFKFFLNTFFTNLKFHNILGEYISKITFQII